MNAKLPAWFPAVLVAVTVVGSLIWYWNHTHITVWFVNPFEDELSLRVRGQKLAVAPHGRTQLVLSTGPVEIEARLGARVVESIAPVLPPGMDLVIYNPLGIASIFRVWVEYSARPNKGDNKVDFLGGGSWQPVNRADFIFTKPPETISLGANSAGETRILITDNGRVDWEPSLGFLISRKRYDTAMNLAAAMSPIDARAAAWGIGAARIGGGMDKAIAYERQELAKSDQYELHRQYQGDRRTRDGLASVREEYRDRLARDPSPMSRLLLARVDGREAAVKTLRELVNDQELGPYARRVLAFRLARVERWPEVVQLLDGNEDPSYVDLRLEALVHAGERDEAMALARKAAADLNVPAETLLETVLLLRPDDAGRFIKDLARDRPGLFSDPGEEIILRVLTGMSGTSANYEPSTLKAVARLSDLAMRDPASAWPKADKLSDDELVRLDARVALLLAAEYHRAGDPRLATRLIEHAQRSTPIPVAAAWRFVDKGEEGDDVRELDGSARAALVLARARAVEAAGGDGAPLRRKIAGLVPLGGPVAIAAGRWPKGKKALDESPLDVPVVFKLVTAR